MALPGVGHALGLGRAVGEPVLGETLLIEVPVTGTLDRPLDSECVSVRRSPESIDPEYFPRDIAARIDRQGGGIRVVVTTRSSIRQPLVEFRLSIACGYNLSHDYLLMASPRRETVSQPISQPSAAPQKPDAQTAKPATGGSSQLPVSSNAGPGSAVLPDGIAGKTIVLDKDMTLEQLARKHFPGPLRQGRFMRWVAEANPQLFADAKGLRQHKLQVGQELVIPDGVPPRRPGDYRNGLTPLGEPMPAEADAAAASERRKSNPPPADTSSPTTAASSPPGRKDRLVVGSGSGTKRDDKETVALVERLTGMLEQQVTAQASNDEKIKQLEATIEQLGKTISRMEKEAADRETRWQAERQAEKTTRERDAEREWLQLLLAVGVGGILGAGVLRGLRMLAGRRPTPSPSDTLDAISPTVSPEQHGNDPEVAPQEDRKALADFGSDEDVQAGQPRQAAGATPPAASPKSAASAPPESAFAFESGLEEHRERTRQPLQNIEFEPPIASRTPVPEPESVPSDPATAAIELANIMTSMGLAQSAAQTLIDHIRDNPRQSLQQWLKLLEIYRVSGNRAEFEKYASEVRQHFNVQPDGWGVGQGNARASLEDYPHIRSNLVALWRKSEAVPVLQALLMDNREGTRAGFPQAVAEEILLLLAIANAGSVPA